jgi:biotin synthase-like enzyme
MSSSDSDGSGKSVTKQMRPPTEPELDEAATAISTILKQHNIPHALCGGYWRVKKLKSNSGSTMTAVCILQTSANLFTTAC